MAEANADGSDETESDAEAYDGLFGAIAYAFRVSRSQLFKLYTVVGVLAAVLVTVFMVLALVTLFGKTATAHGGLLTLSRAFYVVVALFVVGPLLAPVLLVARRHRRTGNGGQYDTWLGLSGFVFLASLYIGLVIAVPTGQQEPITGLFAPIVAVLYALPQQAGLVPPLVAAAGIWVVHRLQSQRTN